MTSDSGSRPTGRDGTARGEARQSGHDSGIAQAPPESCSTKAADAKVELVRDAIWNELCPGIRRTTEDDEHYSRAARAAITALEVADVPQGDGVPPSGSGSRASHEAADASSPKASIPNAAEAALELIYLTDWGWRGGGSDERVSGRAGELARRVLGFPALSRGWAAEPVGSRLCELTQIIDAGTASAIEARQSQAELHRLGPQGKSAVAKPDAQGTTP